MKSGPTRRPSSTWRQQRWTLAGRVPLPLRAATTHRPPSPPTNTRSQRTWGRAHWFKGQWKNNCAIAMTHASVARSLRFITPNCSNGCAALLLLLLLLLSTRRRRCCRRRRRHVVTTRSRRLEDYADPTEIAGVVGRLEFKREPWKRTDFFPYANCCLT